MTLQKRLAKLEARCHGLHDGPRVIMFKACRRDDDGNLQSITQIANVLTSTGWETISRETDETEEKFQLRAETMKDQNKSQLNPAIESTYS